MTIENQTGALLRLRVATDPDPGVLPRILGYFQNLDLTPRRVVAEFTTSNRMYLQIDVFGMPEERLSVLTAKIGQFPTVLNAYWHHL